MAAAAPLILTEVVSGMGAAAAAAWRAQGSTVAIEEASWPMTTAREAGSMDGRRKGAEDRRAKKEWRAGVCSNRGGQ